MRHNPSKTRCVGNAVRRAVYELASPEEEDTAAKRAETAFKARKPAELFNAKEPDNVVSA